MLRTGNTLPYREPLAIQIDSQPYLNTLKFWPYCLILAVFLFIGLIGHDPWKADEAYVFGMIHESQGMVAITGPVHPEQPVVILGNYELQDGMKVREETR